LPEGFFAGVEAVAVLFAAAVVAYRPALYRRCLGRSLRCSAAVVACRSCGTRSTVAHASTGASQLGKISEISFWPQFQPLQFAIN
jgi:hypothetical protein